MSSAIAGARKKAAAAADAARGTPLARQQQRRGPAAAAAAPSPAAAATDAPSPTQFGGHGDDDSDLDDDDAGCGVDGAVYVCFLHEKSVAGLAYYTSASGCIAATSLHCPDADVPHVVASFKAQLPAATLVITSSHAPDAVRRELGCARDAATGEVTEGAVGVQVIKHATFAPALCRQLLDVVCGAGGGGGGHGAQLGSFLDANDGQQLRAAGGLLHWLLKSGVISSVDASGGAAAALPGGVRMFSLRDFMQLDALSFSALSIFAREAHPALGGAGGGKEGFSLCALLDRTVSTAGRRTLRAWCLQPSLDAEVITHRHDAVGFLMAARAQAPELWRELRGCLKHFKDAPRLLARIKAVKSSSRDWFGLAQTILAAGMVRDQLQLLLTHVVVPLAPGGSGGGGGSSGSDGGGGPLAPSTPYSTAAPFLLRAVVAEFGPELTFLSTTLDAIIDWGASREAGAGGRLAVQHGLDARLDEYRRFHADLPEFLSRVSLQELQAHPSLASLTMRYLPQIGVVVELDKAENGLLPEAPGGGMGGGGMGGGGGLGDGMGDGMGDGAAAAASSSGGSAGAVVPPTFELAYETASELVFKTPKTRELDLYVGDVAGTIADLEASIIRQLEEKLLEYEVLLLGAAQRLAELDVLTSFAEVAQDYRYVRPRLHAEPVLLVKGARHPLQELTVDAFVPNDIALAPGRPSAGGAVALITGPNASGKSVYVKTAGLIVFMTQIGCFVPAEKALVGLVDRIFTRIASLESAATAHASSFTVDLNQVGLMLRHATPRSLLLLDEFGKGTASVDGVALLAATVRTLLGLARPPKVIITTHFREVFDYDLLGLQPPPAAGASGGGGSTTARAGAGLPLPPLPPAATGELALYQMQVVLDRRERAAALAGRPGTVVAPAAEGAAAERQLLADGGGGAGDCDNDDDADTAAGGGGGEPLGDDDVVVPLFRLVPGRADASYGLDCARKGGIPKAVIDRARVVTRSLAAPGGRVTALPTPPPSSVGARRERAQLQLARLLLGMPDWRAASAEQLVAALAALRAVHS